MRGARAQIRRIRADEIDRLIPLCIEHAAYERAKPFDATGLVERLRVRISSEPSKLIIWIAHLDGTLVGYASVTPEFSTWHGRDYWHLDCLYIVAHMRRAGIGRELMRVVSTEAREQGVMELQWQTPEWNVDAQRFYARLGASMQLKARFTLAVSAAQE